MTTADAFGDYDGNLAKADFLQFVEEYHKIETALAGWGDSKKTLRKQIKESGFSLRQFDRALKESSKSEAERNADDREFRRNMIWMGFPIGYQTDLFGYEAPPSNGEDTTAEPADQGDVSEHQVQQVEDAGRAAGEAGADRDSNPWIADSFLHGRWDTSWLEGQATIAGQIAPLRRGRRRLRR